MSKTNIKKKFKHFSLVSTVFSLLLISFFIQFAYIPTPIQNINNNSNLETPIIDDRDLELNVASANISDVTVTKTETISLGVAPNGTILTKTAKVVFELENPTDSDVYFDFIDRCEGGEADSFHALLETPEPTLTTKHDVLFVNWTDIHITPQNTTEISYLVETHKEVPIELDVSYYINQTIPVDLSNGSSEAVCPIGSNFSVSVNMKAKNSSFYSSSGLVNPLLLALVTAMLPSEGFGDVDSNLPVLLETDISLANQVTWGTIITNETVLNFSLPVLDGGGWGIIELEPLSINLIMSSDLFSLLFSGAAALLGVQTGLELFWSYLTFESMIDQFITISSMLELLIDVMISDFGLISSMMYSALGNLDMTNLDPAALLSLTNQNGSIFSLLKLDHLYDFINGIEEDSVFEEDWNLLNYLDGYMDSKAELLKMIEGIQAGIISSLGAQLISIFGTPMNMTYEASNKTREVWNSSDYNGLEMTNAIMSNDLDHNNRSELIVSMYNVTSNTSTLVAHEFNGDADNNDYQNVWNSTDGSDWGGQGDVTIYGKIESGCLQIGDLDGDDDREIIFGTNDGNVTIYEFTGTLLLNTYAMSQYYVHDYSTEAVSSLLNPSVNIQTDTENIIFGLENGSIIVANPSNTGDNYNDLTFSSIEWNKDLGGKITDISLGNTDADNFIELICYNTSHALIYENITGVPALGSGLFGLWNVSIESSRLMLEDVTNNGSDNIISIDETSLNVTESVVVTETVVVSPTESYTFENVTGYNVSVWSENVTSILSNSTNLTSLYSGDLDEDGTVEIITAFENGTLHFYEWNGTGFSKDREYIISGEYGCSELIVYDINNNGHLDLILLGTDSKIHVFEDILSKTLYINIFVNLTRDPIDNTKTNLYTKIVLDNFPLNITIPDIPLLPPIILYISEEFVYNGEGPTVTHLGMSVSENVTSYNKTLITINRTLVDTDNAVSAVYIGGTTYDVQDVTYWGDKTNITLSAPGLAGSGQINCTVNYTYYMLVDPIFGYNLTTFPPYNYSHPITGSIYPAIYPFLLEMLSTSHSSIIKMIGNLTSSLAKQYLMLNATFSDEMTLGLDKPIELLSGFSVLDLFELFNNIIETADSPFGNPLSQQLSTDQLGGDLGGFDLTSMMGETAPIQDMSFTSMMKIFLEPNIQTRFLYNVTIPGNFTDFSDPMFLPRPDNILIEGEGISLESISMNFTDGYEIFGNTTMNSQTTLSLKLNPLLITDVNDDNINDSIIVVNGFYPDYNIICINNYNDTVLWNVSLPGPVVHLEMDEINEELILIMRNTKYNITAGDSPLNASRLFVKNGSSVPNFDNLDLTFNNSLEIFYNDTYIYTGAPSYDVDLGVYSIQNYQVSLRPYVLADNSSIFVVDNTISLYNGNATGQKIKYETANWTREFNDVIEYCEVDDIDDDGEVEIIIGTISGYVFVLSLVNELIWQYRIDGALTKLEVNDINGDGIKDVIFSSVNKIIYALNGSNRALLIKFEAEGIINDFDVADFDEDGLKDLVFGSSDKIIYVVNSTNDLIWSFNTSYHHNTTNEYVKSIKLAYLTESTNLSLFYGAGDNYLRILNLTDNQTTSKKYVGHEVTVFKLFRTNESISLQFDLSDPIMSMLSSFGELNMDTILSMLGSGSATAGSMLGSSLSLDLDSILGGAGGMDLGIDITQITGLLPSGIGLLNLMMWKLDIIMSLMELSSVMGAQHEFTGQPELRGSGDFLNVSEYFNVSQNKSIINNMTRYEIESLNETANMQVNYFNVLLSDDSSPNDFVNESRIQFWAWNGSEYVNLQNNSIFNLTLSMLDISIEYTNSSQGNHTEIKFRPFSLLLPLKSQNISVDWNGRVVYFNISGDYNETYWIDVSYMHPNVVYGMTMTTIGHSLTYPVIIVFLVEAPYIDMPPADLVLLLQLIQSPIFYFMVIMLSILFVEFSYLKRRSDNQLDEAAAKNLDKWLNKRKASWEILAANGLLHEKQHETLRHFKSRIKEAVRVHPIVKKITTKFEERKFLSQTIGAVFLKDFWNEFGKRNRLAVMLDQFVDVLMIPINKMGAAFMSILPKTSGTKQRMAELKEKEAKVKKRREEEKKKVKETKKVTKKKVLDDDLIKDIESKLKKDIHTLKQSKPKKKKFKKPTQKKWKGELKGDGGNRIKDTIIRVRKKLPDFFTEEGKIFYALSKNRYIGTTTEELAKVIDKKILATIPVLIKLYEKGLIILLQEGDRLGEDLWDVASTLRKTDPDIEKMLYTTKFLDESLDKTIEELQKERKEIKK